MEQDWVRKMINVGNHSWVDDTVELSVSMATDTEHSYLYDLPLMLSQGKQILIYQ